MPLHKRSGARERGYTAKWDKARKAYLSRNPLCVLCQQEGKTTAATVVDHINAHHGDWALFWDSQNWQPLCTNHHNSHKQSIEKGGHGRMGCNASGLPVDPAHPWNK